MSRRDVKHANKIRTIQAIVDFCDANRIAPIIIDDHIEIEFYDDVVKLWPYDRKYQSIAGNGTIPFKYHDIRNWLESYVIHDICT